MLNYRSLRGLAVVALMGAAAACGTDDTTETEAVSREVITEPTTTEVEVQVPTEDTALVERRVEVERDVSVDTIENPDIERRTP